MTSANKIEKVNSILFKSNKINDNSTFRLMYKSNLGEEEFVKFLNSIIFAQIWLKYVTEMECYVLEIY